MRPPPYTRRTGQPITLAEQLAAWSAHRAGDSTAAIATSLRRLPSEARAILHGAA